MPAMFQRESALVNGLPRGDLEARLAVFGGSGDTTAIASPLRSSTRGFLLARTSSDDAQEFRCLTAVDWGAF